MTTNNNNDNNGNNKNNENWLGFSLSPQSSSHSHPSSSNPTTFFNLSSHFNYQNLYCGGNESVNGGGIYSAFPIMPLKSDGSLCLMDSVTRSHSQGMVSSTTPPPKLENFFGGVTMGTPDLDNSSTMYYHQNYQIQPPNYLDYNGFYQSIQQDQESKETQIVSDGIYLPNIGEDDMITNGMKNWISTTNYHSAGGAGGIQSLSLSISPGCSQSSSCVTGSQQQITNVVMDSKKRGSEKVEQQQKQIVHRKSLDTFGQRTSQYRGVTRHRWTGRYEAHLWDNSCKKEGQTRKGRQVYLGGYDMEEKAARAYDLAALKYWGPSTHINFPLENYEKELEEMKNMSRQEYVAHLRRRSSGFSRGASVYRGVTRHHHHGRWQARIGRVAGNKDLYLGTFSTQEDAAEAYDVAAIKFRGVNAVTNFDISRYNVEKIMASNTLLAGELARRTKDPDPSDPDQVLSNQTHNGQETKTISNETITNSSMLDWKMEDESSTIRCHLLTSGTGGGYQEDSPQNNNFPMVLGLPPPPPPPPPPPLAVSKSMNTWIPTATTTSQVRSHIPIFAAWTDA